VPKEFVDLGISTRIATFRVLSNWGGDVTCIYRVSVHIPIEPLVSTDFFRALLDANHAVQVRVHGSTSSTQETSPIGSEL
jgi:hypothetical protein